MLKQNIVKTIAKMFDSYELWIFFKEMIEYYLSLRKVTYEELCYKLGYSNKSSMTNCRNGYFTPRQIEIIIAFLEIDDDDANRMRAKYWAVFCEQEIYNCKFNRLYAMDHESIIRELKFKNKKLETIIKTIDNFKNLACDIIVEQELKSQKTKP